MHDLFFRYHVVEPTQDGRYALFQTHRALANIGSRDDSASSSSTSSESDSPSLSQSGDRPLRKCIGYCNDEGRIDGKSEDENLKDHLRFFLPSFIWGYAGANQELADLEEEVQEMLDKVHDDAMCL